MYRAYRGTVVVSFVWFMPLRNDVSIRYLSGRPPTGNSRVGETRNKKQETREPLTA